MTVYVMHTEGLSGFYVMLKDQESALEDLATRLEERYANAPLPVADPVAKLPCVAFYPKDGAWYRAKVVRDMTVQFVDYGNADTVSEIREIAPEFLDVPPFCYKCKLEGAKELAGASSAFEKLVADAELELEVLTWGQEVTVRLSKDGADITTMLREQLAESNAAAQAEAASVSVDADTSAPVREAGTVTHVDGLNSFYVLFSARQADLDALGERLQEALASGSAATVDKPDGSTLYGALYSEDGLWYRARVEGAAAEGGLRVRFVDYGNVETVESVVVLDSEFHVEPFCVECQLAGLSSAAGPSAVEKFKQLVLDADLQVETVAPGKPASVRLLTVDGVDLLSHLPVQKGYTNCEVPLHQKVRVQVSHVESATDFFVQLDDRLDALETLTTQLFELPPSDSAPVDTSLPCMVFWSDEVPYRATVLETSDSTVALVRFVDYGNCDTVEVAGIRQLPSSLVDIPLFAIHCTLDIPEGKLGEEAAEELRRLAESEPATSLLAEFLEERNGRYVVRLLDMGIDVLGKLLQDKDGSGNVSPDDAAKGSASEETPETAPISETGGEGEATAPTVVEAAASGGAQDSVIAVPAETITSLDVDETEGKDGVGKVEEATETAVSGGSDLPVVNDDENQDETAQETEAEADGEKLDEEKEPGKPASDAEPSAQEVSAAEPPSNDDSSVHVQEGEAEEQLPPVIEEDALAEDQAEPTTAGDLPPEQLEEATTVEDFEGTAAPTSVEGSGGDDGTVETLTEEPQLEAPAGAAPLDEQATIFKDVESEHTAEQATAEDSGDENVTVVIRTEEPVAAEAAAVESSVPTHPEDGTRATSGDGKVQEAVTEEASAGSPSVEGPTSEQVPEDTMPAGVSAPNTVPEATTTLDVSSLEVAPETELAEDSSLVVAEETPVDGSQPKEEPDTTPAGLETATVGSVDKASASELAKEGSGETKPEKESDAATVKVESALSLEKLDEGSPQEACVPTPEDSPVVQPGKEEGPSSPQRAGANDSSAAGAVTPVTSATAIGAGGDAASAVPNGSPAAGFKAEGTTSPHPTRRKMPDECPIPGVCTNPELFASPSDEGN